jgi:hypothetical protein
MSNIWAPVVAALGASLLTGGFGFGVVWWQAQQAKKSALSERRSRAYSMLLVQSASVMRMARGIHVTMEYRSGLREGLNVLSGKGRYRQTAL